jgi:hypothetical protein
MGGGGGGWSRWAGTFGGGGEKAAANEAAASAYEAAANGFLQDLLSAFNTRDTEAIRRHLDVLQQAIEKGIDGVTALLFGGSVQKHTYVDGLSDVDVLLIVNDSSLSDTSPQSVLQYVENRLQERLPNTAVKAGTLAVTVTYADGTQIQLLPALKTATGVCIANADASGWSNVVRPQEFARKLTQVNQTCGNKVVPVIKLFKGLQSRLPEKSQLTGYHVESLAIEAFKNYSGRQTYKDMLHHFLQVAATRVQSSIADTTGQSLHVDDYLGATGSADRMRVSKALERLTNKIAQADARASLDMLRALFGE